ncbi:MAG: ParA family protein [Sedimenticola sp.]|nr:ParA family protein [Sedimenticola sp.]
MQTVAVFNPQSGVGKTTLCANLGHALALAGHPLTLVDFDPAGDLSASLGLFRAPTQGIDQVLLEQATLEAVSISTRDEVHLIPAGSRLSEWASGSISDMEKGKLLGRLLSAESSETDLLLFDCPSNADLLIANILLAVDWLLIPLPGDDAGAESLPHLLQTIETFSRARGRPLNYLFVMNRIPVRRRLTGVAASKFSALAPGHFCKSVICQSDQLEQARQIGRTIFESRSGSRPASDFSQLASELVRRSLSLE